MDLTAEERTWLDENPDKLRMHFDVSFPPLEYIAEDGTFTGMGADIVDLVQERLGVEILGEPSYDWNTQLADLKSGDVPIAPTIVRTDEREEYAFFTKPYVEVPLVIIGKPSLPDSMDLDDLNGLRVAVVSGYASEGYLRDHAPGRFELVPVENVHDGLRSVSFGQVDALVANLAVAAYMIEQEGISNLRVAGGTGYSFKLSIAVSRKYPLLYSSIRKALDAVTDSELETVRKRWISLQIAAGPDPETVRIMKLAAVFAVLLVLGLAGISYLLKRSLNEKVRSLRAAQGLLLDQSERLKLATEATHAGIWDYSPATGKVHFSEQWYTMLGDAPGPLDATLEEWTERIHTEERDATTESLRQYVDAGGEGEFEAEFRMCHADGAYRGVLGRGRAIAWNGEGVPTRVIGLNLDIQKAKEIQKEMVDSEARFRAIFDNAPYSIVINSLEGERFLDANRTFLENWGIEKEDLVKLNVRDTIEHPDAERARVIAMIQDGGGVHDREVAVRRADGSMRHVIYSSALINVRGEQQVLSMTVDVTKRKRAEEALRQSEETFRALAENSEDVIMRFDRELRHTYVNSVVERRTGMPAESFIGKTHEELGFPEDLCHLWAEAVNRVFDTGEVNRIEFQLPTGAWSDWLLMPEFRDGDRVEAVITASRDITDRKRTEEDHDRLQKQLMQSQKMEAVGVLAGGVAHDFNNMLGAIIGYAELTLDAMDPEDPLRGNLEEVLSAAQRSTSLTRQLLAFARKQAVAPVVLDLNESVEHMLRMLRRLIGEDIELVWRPGPSTSTVKMDPSQLDQILANLCVNARDAISDVGQVVIETTSACVDEHYCSGHADASPGDYVLLAVSDDGHGMDRETVEHAFEPFFTTKGLGEGTGLGLATVYGIVKQNDGFINLYSEPDGGTTFKIYLPSHAGEPESMRHSSGQDIPRGQGETVLHVEDEPALLSMGRSMLQRLGYTVLSAATPSEAIRLATEHDADIHLFLTDVVMPEMNGRDLADRIRAIRPDTKHLFVSGYTANVVVDRGILDEEVNFIQKPFSLKELATKVRETLGQD
ncbi:MAG: PAS domain S-box protein [bacterium]|nr:PAS domain S-box protein [bacterium]